MSGLPLFFFSVTAAVCVFVLDKFNCQQKGAMTVTKVVTVVKTKKGPHTHKKKGELMENDQDAMEVNCCCRPNFNKSSDSHMFKRELKSTACFNFELSFVYFSVLLRGGGGGSTDSSHWVPDKTEESSGAC